MAITWSLPLSYFSPCHPIGKIKINIIVLLYYQAVATTGNIQLNEWHSNLVPLYMLLNMRQHEYDKSVLQNGD